MTVFWGGLGGGYEWRMPCFVAEWWERRFGGGGGSRLRGGRVRGAFARRSTPSVARALGPARQPPRHTRRVTAVAAWMAARAALRRTGSAQLSRATPPV